MSNFDQEKTVISSQCYTGIVNVTTGYYEGPGVTTGYYKGTGVTLGITRDQG